MKRSLKILIALLVVLLAALAVNAYLVDHKTKPAKADVGWIVDLPGGDIQTIEDSGGDAPPVVLIHGWTAAANWWARIVPHFVKRRHVMRFDLLGHGGSAKPRNGYSIREQADRLAAALHKIGKGERVDDAMIVGHSTGGEVAIALAARHPDLARSLVVIDSEPDEDYGKADFLTKLSVKSLFGELLWGTAPDSSIRDGLKQAFINDKVPVPEQFVKDLKKMTYSSYQKTWHKSADYVEDGELEHDIKSVRVPIMIMFGAGDRLIDANRSIALYRQWLPHAQIAVVQGAGHSPLWEQPARTSTAMLHFDDRNLNAGKCASSCGRRAR